MAEHKAFDKERMSRFWGKVKTYVATAISGLYTKPSGGIPKSDLSSSVQSSLDKADSALQAHQTLKTIGGNTITGSGNIAWPSYTANDVGALADTTKLSDLPDDTGHRTVSDTEKAAWDAKLSAETDPTVPSWAKESTKPSYTAEEVGAMPSSTNVYNANSLAVYYSYKSKTACGRYMILLTYDEEYVLPLTSENNNTNPNKTMTDLSFDPFGQVYYYGATTARSAEQTFPNGNTSVYVHSYNVAHLAYSFNISGTLTERRAFYLVMVPQSDGRCKLHSTPYAQTLPTTEDGLVYKYLGMVVSGDALMFSHDKPCYYYSGGKIRLWTGG